MRPNLSIDLEKTAFTSSTFETSNPTTRTRFKASTSNVALSSAWTISGLRVVAMTDFPDFRSSCNRAFPTPEDVPVTVQHYQLDVSLKNSSRIDYLLNQTSCFCVIAVVLDNLAQPRP